MSNSFISTCEVLFYQVLYTSLKWGLLFLVVRIIVKMINVWQLSFNSSHHYSVVVQLWIQVLLG